MQEIVFHRLPRRLQKPHNQRLQYRPYPILLWRTYRTNHSQRKKSSSNSRQHRRNANALCRPCHHQQQSRTHPILPQTFTQNPQIYRNTNQGTPLYLYQQTPHTLCSQSTTTHQRILNLYQRHQYTRTQPPMQKETHLPGQPKARWLNHGPHHRHPTHQPTTIYYPTTTTPHHRTPTTTSTSHHHSQPAYHNESLHT